MRVCWILAGSFDDPLVEPEKLADVGSTWGSWRTWRAWHTDNVLCNNEQKATTLIERAFQAVCNLYVPKRSYARLGRPVGVKMYDGEFPEEIPDPEDIIAMHLVAGNSDLVLLLGYDLVELETEDRLAKHDRKRYLAAFAGAVKQYPNVQWVVIDHPAELADNIRDLENISCDTYENVLQLLG